ncbi:TetR/AcrR family transcriptional regulator [Nakamurella leprariae]|uniref:TetR/AcrR family transcriptional regulator n=1 Tax=Nakamurella leprariae TaxID=2803911 RepID=UPI002E291942|nr:helix-turn-helix domain-containing protein [Nakamurella leprariae]
MPIDWNVRGGGDVVSATREDKKTATRARIAKAGLELFVERGYDATTVDEIAEAAGIARRTFFYYFKTKDEVLLAWHGAGAVSSGLVSAMLRQSTEQAPFDAGKACIIDLAARYETEESKAMDALMRSSASLRARKDATEVQLESDMADAMVMMWPDPARRAELRMASMIAVGVLRLSLEEWRGDDSANTLTATLERHFSDLERHILRT